MNMQDDSELAYRQLAARLNELPNGFPPAPDGAELRLLPHEGGAGRLEGVQVQVQVEDTDGPGAPVAPGEPLAPLERVLHRIEDHPDLVVGNPVGKGRLAAGALAAPCPRRARRPDGAGLPAGAELL